MRPHYQIIEKFLRENKKRYPVTRDLVKACMKKLGVTESPVYQHIRKIYGLSSPGLSEALGKTDGLTKDQLRDLLDYKYKLRKAVSALSKDVLFVRRKFKVRFGLIDSLRFKEAADSKEFSKYRAVGGGNEYWSHPETIRQLKKEGILQ